MLTLEPTPIAEAARTELREVLDLMSLGSLRRFLAEIEGGHVDGSWYGGNFEWSVSERSLEAKGRPFIGCLLGWAGFLEQRSVLDLVTRLPWFEGGIRPGGVEHFVANIAPGDTPATSAHSAALYRFVSTYLADRQAAKEQEQEQEQEELQNANA